MARRPNYAHERFERNKAKQAKREAKLKQRQEAASERKTATDEPAADAPAESTELKE
jgi:hypothetical protein